MCPLSLSENTGRASDFSSARAFNAFIYRLLSVAWRFVNGGAIKNDDGDRLIINRFGGLPLALRVAHIAVRSVPLIAIFLFVISFWAGLTLEVSDHDKIALALFFFAGILLGYVSFRAPHLSVHAYLSVRNLRPIALLSYLLLFLIIPFLFEAVLLRRVFDGVLLLPMIAAAWVAYRSNPSAPWMARFFPLAFAVMAAIPGFILPPYYGGIAGWTTSVELKDTVPLYGFQLENDAGAHIWLTHTIFTPVTQVGRFARAWESKEGKIGPIGAFIMKAYRRAYPLLQSGYMPHERYLGHFAYPPHTSAVNLPDHHDFPPDRIVRVELVELIYDRSGQLIRRDIYSTYNVPHF